MQPVSFCVSTGHLKMESFRTFDLIPFGLMGIMPCSFRDTGKTVKSFSFPADAYVGLFTLEKVSSGNLAHPLFPILFEFWRFILYFFSRQIIHLCIRVKKSLSFCM